MTEPIPREDVIELLNRLGSDRDEDVLEAAREVHARITAGNMTWDQLLVPDHADDDDDDESNDDESNDDEIDDDEIDDESEDDESEDSDDSDAIESSDSDEEATEPAGAAGAKDAPDAKNAESLALIDKLLAMRGISTDLREELKGYKTDIAEGEFETRDHRYLRAVHARLSKRR
jgi:hypothetical protein